MTRHPPTVGVPASHPISCQQPSPDKPHSPKMDNTHEPPHDWLHIAYNLQGVEHWYFEEALFLVAEDDRRLVHELTKSEAECVTSLKRAEVEASIEEGRKEALKGRLPVLDKIEHDVTGVKRALSERAGDQDDVLTRRELVDARGRLG